MVSFHTEYIENTQDGSGLGLFSESLLYSLPPSLVCSLSILTVSAAIVRKHGGHIGVLSSGVPGSGSVFYIDLPIPDDLNTNLMEDSRFHSLSYDYKRVIPQHPIDIASDLPRMSPRLSSHTDISPTLPNAVSTLCPQSSSFGPTPTEIAPHDLHFNCAVVVDDSVMTRKMLVKLIGGHFTTILQGGDGLEAVQIMKSQLALGVVPNVVFLDSIMPNMSGIDACREIRGLGYQGIILAVTGNVLPSDIEEFLSAGADKLIPKPIKIGDIKTTLEGSPSCCSSASLLPHHSIEYYHRIQSPDFIC
jgi:CheY-like chemotaxis protein